jgi:eukaryotic-like serine/threonine-protein kinase
MAYTIDALKAALHASYRIEREIGAGGMATVHLAEDVRHHRKVAIKVLHAEIAAVIGAQRFLAEIQTIATLQHPHILGLIDSGEVEGIPYYVMPFVEGESLRDRLTREKQLPIDDTVQVAREIADALSHAHARGVIHRDIKPENILLQDGHALLADFGISLALKNADRHRLTGTGLSLGTPAYMSPEQAMGEREITARSDVFALAAITYEMLAGDPPFSGSGAQAIVAKVLTEKPASIVARRARVPRDVENVILRALEKLPADRYASAIDFARALSRAAMVGTAALASESGGRDAFTAPLSQNTWWKRGIALGGGAVLGGALAVWGIANSSAPPGETRFHVVLPRTLTLTNDQTLGVNIAISPNGRLVVFAATGADGRRWLYARSLDELIPRPLVGTEGASQPFFSPDGKWIGFWSAGGMRKVKAEGGVPEEIAQMPEYVGASWTSRRVIVYGQGRALYSIPDDGGNRTRVAAPDTGRGEIALLYPVALEDGDHVLYMSAGDARGRDRRISMVSMSTRTSQVVDIAGNSALGVIDGHLLYSRQDHTLLGVEFNPATGKTKGTPVAIASNVTLVAGGVAKAALSSSGTLLYRDGARESRLLLTNGQDAVDMVLETPRVYSHPRFSPSGRSIALSIDGGIRTDVFLYDIESNTLTQLSTGGSINDRAEWSPDGARVLYRTNESSRNSIWWRAADLSGPSEPLLPSIKTPVFEAVMALDGHTIVYQVDPGGQPDILARSLTGDTAPVAIAATKHAETLARVSPNGRWVAYVTHESGSSEVVVQSIAGGGRRVQVSDLGGTEPVWARDSRRLFYRSNNKFTAVTLTFSPTLAVAQRARIMDDRFVSAAMPHANYDVAPDGKRLLVIEPLVDNQLLLLHGWTARLRDKSSVSTTGR